MQILADQLRLDDEQAVTIQRDLTLDNNDEEFDSKKIYGQFKASIEEKKRVKREVHEAEEQAIIDERREWNLAMS